MPYQPARPCSFPGCPALVNGRYCPAHQKEINRRYNQYERDPASRERYGAEWRRIRERFIAAHPLCELCKGRGRLTPATEVHHKAKIADGGTNDEENLQALCRKCHSRISAVDENRWRRKG